jgi:hypothetical protein
MSKIFKDQTHLRIRLTTGVSIVGAKETKIYYLKPEGAIGSVDASVYDPATGIIYYDLLTTPSLLNEVGAWRFWSYIKFSDDRVARGESLAVQIYDNQE